MLIAALTFVGLHNLFETTDVQQMIKVDKIFAHEGFSYAHMKNDIALLKLSTPVKLSDKVNTVCLPAQGSRIPDGYNCYITGTVFRKIYLILWGLPICVRISRINDHFVQKLKSCIGML